MKKKKLKRYRLKINPEKGSVVDYISQVETPAIEVGFLKFNREKLKIRPGSSETEQEFISRCIPFEISEGYPEDQAAAICYSMWERRTETEEHEPNMDVFGYKTQHFYMCPVAMQVFGDLVKMPIDERNVGMVRSAAQIADSVFRIEEDVIENGMATSAEMNEVLLLVSDFKDVMDQLNKELNLELDPSFMDAHVETVSSYLGENLKDFVDACWEGYEPVGFKIVDGQRVPNCVPIKEQAQFKSEVNDEKMELFGPVLIPDLPIYRQSEAMGEYEIIFKKEDIKEIAMNFMKSGYQKNVNLDHSDNMADSYVFESFISNELVPNPKPYQDLPLGTWFVRMKVNDKEVWKDIKEGKRTGFSIEGIFEYMVEEFEKSYKQEKQPTNYLNKQEKLNLEKMIKDLFKKIFNELSQELDEKAIDLSDYQKVASSDYKVEAREVGQKVEVVDAMGNLQPAPDGAYEFEDGFKFMVSNGVISEIDGVTEEEPMSEDAETAEVEAKKNYKKQYMDMLADYPWEQCIADMAEEGYTEEQANAICGSIRWNNMGGYKKPEDEMKEDELASLKVEFEEIKSKMISKEEILEEIALIKQEFKAVFDKFSQIPAQPSKVAKPLQKDIENQKFQSFLNSIRKPKN